jgi:hypothetical protein
MFEERLFRLLQLVRKAAAMLTAEDIPYEVVGGMAVAAHLDRADRDEVMLTRDVDIMIHRSDLERVQAAAARHGLPTRVHFICDDTYPPAAGERINLYGCEVAVAPAVDLVRMKLSSYKDDDRVHVRALDAVGLITPDVERTLPAALQSRLQHIRETE